MFGEQLSKETSMESSQGDGTTEVVARPVRRRHTIAYKLKVLETVGALRAEGNGAIGAYLRKEGLYYSSVQLWRRQQAQGKLTSGRRGSKQKSRENLLSENKRLRRQNEHLEKRLKKTELIVELQKKLSQVLLYEAVGQNDESTERPDEP